MDCLLEGANAGNKEMNLQSSMIPSESNGLSNKFASDGEKSSSPIRDLGSLISNRIPKFFYKKKVLDRILLKLSKA